MGVHLQAADSEARVANGARSESRESGPGNSARNRRVRVTVDLTPKDYDILRDFAYFARMSHAGVLRCLIRLLTSDEDVAQQVRSSATRVR